MEEKKEFKYIIGDRVYYQRKLVMGQVNQLIEVTKNLEIPSNPSTMQLITAFGDKITEAIAVVLVPADMKLKEKHVGQVVSDIQFELEPEMVLEVMEDFFACNQISLLLKKLTNVIEKAVERISPEKTVEVEQANSASSSQEVTP